MKHLLLISNISSENRELIEYAAKFCKHYNSILHILHVSQEINPVLISSEYYFKGLNIHFENDRSKIIAQKIVNIISPILEKKLIQVKIQQGKQDNILKKFIVENNIDMIILGNMDLNRDSDFIEHKNILINDLNTPLIVIPEYQIFQPLRKFNFLIKHTKKDLEDILKLTGLFPQAKIKLTHLNNKLDSKELLKNEKWVEYVKDKVGTQIGYEIINEELKVYVKNKNSAVNKTFDAFVFTSHKRNFWSRLLDPSTTLRFLSGLDIPSIIFKTDAYDQDE